MKILDKELLTIVCVAGALCPSFAINLEISANSSLKESDVSNVGYAGSVLDIGLSESSETDVTFSYCFEFDDVANVGTTVANFNDVDTAALHLPICGVEFAVARILEGTTTIVNPIKVWINDDQLVENREFFRLKLFNLAGGTFGNNSRERTVLLQIVDDDNTVPCDVVSADKQITTLEDSSFVFKEGVFPAQCADGSSLAYNVIIKKLPAKGSLLYNGVSVTTGQSIASGNLDMLVYKSALNEYGSPYASVGFAIEDPAQGVTTDEYSLNINVTPTNDIPDATGCNANVAENVPAGTAVCQVQASDVDGDALTFEIVSGNTPLDANNRAPFAINASTGAITVNGLLDYEQKSYYNLTVRVKDSYGARVSVNVLVNIQNVAEAPVVEGCSVTIVENLSANTNTGCRIVANDPEGGTLTYSITAGNAGNLFGIDNNGRIIVDGNIDYESINPKYFTLTVRVSSSRGLTATATARIDISDEDESPSAIGVSCFIRENTKTFIEGTNCRILATDPEGSALSFSIIEGNVNSTFAINSSTGVITANKAPDYEEISAYPLVIGVSDGPGVLLVPADITVINVNESPTVTVTNATVGENSPVNTLVTWVNASDNEDGYNLTYEIVGGNDDGAFKIVSSGQGNGDDGNILVADDIIDYEVKNSYNLSIRICDQGSPGTASDRLCVTSTVKVTVTDKNERPSVTGIPDQTIDEHTAVGTVVGIVTGADPENGPISYSFAGGNNGQAFAINSSTGVITVNRDIEFDDLVTNPFVIKVVATDGGGLRAETMVSITISEIEDETPLDIVSRWCATYYGDASAYYDYGTEWCLYDLAEVYQRIPVYVSVIEDGWSVDLQRAVGRQYTLNLDEGLVAFTDRLGYDEVTFPRTIGASGIDTVWLYYDISYETASVVSKTISLSSTEVELQFLTYNGTPSPIVQKQTPVDDGVAKLQVLGREIRINGAGTGKPYAVFDMQGKVISRGVGLASGTTIQLPHAGTYLVRIGGVNHRVQMK